MSKDDNNDLVETLKTQHSKQKKELQGKIVLLKHSVLNNNKKKKKELNNLIDTMEKDLKKRHEEEMKELEEKLLTMLCPESDNKNLSVINKSENLCQEINEIKKVQKPSRAQLKREKKAEEIKKKLALALEDERNAATSCGRIETNEFNGVLTKRNLQLFEILPDGDCLYNALSHQIDKKELSGSFLRKIAAKYIREHPEDFLPFLTNENNNEMTNFDFELYCDRVEQTSQEGGAWGGEIELKAISSALCRKIEVLQPDGSSILFGHKFVDEKPLIVTFHRFAYTLGEHYNSTIALTC